MFDFSFNEMLVAGAVALVVLGPERLPKVARTAGRWAGKIRSLAAGMKEELMRQVEASELSAVKDELQQAAGELQGSLNEAAADIGRDADGLSAWERLPPLKTPADFGIEEDGYAYGTPPAQAGFYTQSLRKQAMARKRDLRPRYRPKPRLRSRR